jgi:CelD/BcsL family acetyltransferase involved in cellulose biosynthesis
MTSSGVDASGILVAKSDPAVATATQSNVQSVVHTLHYFDPLADDRWPEFVERHPHASVFHSIPWLRALRSTYGYRPIAFTRSAPGENLEEAMLFCDVDSWLTGRRLVSVPFSDHCAPLLTNNANLGTLLLALQQRLIASRWRYIEIRSLDSDEHIGPDWYRSAHYRFHRLDLRPSLDTLFRNFHQSSTQRKIRRAEREGLKYAEGSNESFLDQFYRLLVVTRKRHSIPPQPRNWLVNLMQSFGEALKIRLTFKGDQAVAGMLTIRHKSTLYYKYGGSDTQFHNLGAMHLLYWNAIQDAKKDGLTTLDLGRSDADQPGLITFKSRWGAASSSLNYYRFPRTGKSVHAFDAAGGVKMRALKRCFSFSPAFLLPAFGKLLYKHIG